MIQNYIVDKLTLSDLKENGKVVIPNFQRGVVWTLSHRKDFIETVKSGDPFGVVLVSQENPSDPYYLIDGLQRLSTLKAYMDNPLEFIDENDKFIDEEKLNDLFEKKYQKLGLQVPANKKLEKEKKSFLKKMIKALKDEKTIPDSLDIWKKTIAPILEVPVDNSFDVLQSFNKFYKSFTENLELPNIIIHAIVYQGPKERLPYVFETLNTTSVSLTKYEVFSSKWPIKKIKIDDDDLIDKVWSKYESLKKSSSFEVDVTREVIADKGMTLFEYCFGFSELVCSENKTYSFLFNKSKKTTDPTGFELLSLACGMQVNKADDLWKPDFLGNADGKFYIDLKDALMESIKVVASSLKNWVFDLKESAIKNSSNYQVYFMIISVFNHMYKINLSTKEIVKGIDTKWVDDFKKNAFKWYFYHQITGFWNQNRQVSDLRRILDDVDYANLYSTSISKETWEKDLVEYFNSIKESATGRNIAVETKLFLNYLYKLMIEKDANIKKYFEIKEEDGKKIVFDIEHIVPFNKFKNFDDDLPISSLGNLCYLPVKDNRSKGEYTIYEYALDRPSLVQNEKFLDVIDYPKKEDFSFINCSYEQFVAPYNKLILDRESRMIKKYISLIVELY